MTEQELKSVTEEDVKIQKLTKANNRKSWVIIILILMFAGACVAYGYQQKISNTVSQKLRDQGKAIVSLETELELKGAELKVCQAQLEIKPVDKNIIRDISLYIQQYYTRVSKDVAEIIAVNIVKKAIEHGVSIELIVGMIQEESGFNSGAVGPQTKHGRARGLMQVMPAWAETFKIDKSDLYDINTNIECGIRVFLYHLNHKKQGNGKISKGLFYYVNQDWSYVDKVYRAMGKFVSFRATVDSENISENGGKEEEEEQDETDKGAAKTN